MKEKFRGLDIEKQKIEKKLADKEETAIQVINQKETELKNLKDHLTGKDSKIKLLNDAGVELIAGQAGCAACSAAQLICAASVIGASLAPGGSSALSCSAFLSKD